MSKVHIKYGETVFGALLVLGPMGLGFECQCLKCECIVFRHPSQLCIRKLQSCQNCLLERVRETKEYKKQERAKYAHHQSARSPRP
jgi:hypothetical protein